MIQSRRQPSCLIVVENLAVPFDRRVWQEAQALASAGWQVSVICPSSALHPQAEEVLEGINIYRHPIPLEARGILGFFFEYASALYHETRLAFRVYRRHGIDVIHACNPPDLIFLVALPYKLFGAKFVFDQHDICPELYIAKFNRRGIGHAITRACEWLSYRCADLVITANESFKRLCSARNGKKPEDVVAVHSYPDFAKFTAVAAQPNTYPDPRLTIGYVGIIGSQDGVHTLVRAIDVLRNRRGTSGFRCRIVGDGPSCASVKALAQEANLLDCVEFTGFLAGKALLANLSTFDIGVIPDPKDCYTDHITMNKAFEYMFLGKPVVGFKLRETMRVVGECGIFADEETPEALADAIARLLDDSELRTRLGETARRRASVEFSWAADAQKLVDAYANLLPSRATAKNRSLGRFLRWRPGQPPSAT
jgi:glycosyltransferase involved in cell wall biosynthesis